jgi:hypothetical protein
MQLYDVLEIGRELVKAALADLGHVDAARFAGHIDSQFILDAAAEALIQTLFIVRSQRVLGQWT